MPEKLKMKMNFAFLYDQPFLDIVFKVYKVKAKALGDKLLPAFNTPSGIPWGLLNLQRFDFVYSLASVA